MFSFILPVPVSTVSTTPLSSLVCTHVVAGDLPCYGSCALLWIGSKSRGFSSASPRRNIMGPTSKGKFTVSIDDQVEKDRGPRVMESSDVYNASKYYHGRSQVETDTHDTDDINGDDLVVVGAGGDDHDYHRVYDVHVHEQQQDLGTRRTPGTGGERGSKIARHEWTTPTSRIQSDSRDYLTQASAEASWKSQRNPLSSNQHHRYTLQKSLRTTPRYSKKTYATDKQTFTNPYQYTNENARGNKSDFRTSAKDGYDWKNKRSPSHSTSPAKNQSKWGISRIRKLSAEEDSYQYSQYTRNGYSSLEPKQQVLQRSAAQKKQNIKVANDIIKLGQDKNWRAAVDLFFSVQHPDQFMACAVITACRRAGHPRKGLEIFYSLPDRLLWNAPVYGTTIACYEALADSRGALRLLREMKKKKMDLNVIIYTTCISACGQDNRLILARKIMDSMRTEGFIPNNISYNVFIGGCARHGAWKMALDSFDRMRVDGLTPDLVSYNACISACEKAGQWQVALQLLDAIKQQGLECDVISYSSCISACEKGGQWQAALKVFSRMKKDDIQPNTITYNALISACEKGDQSDMAIKVFKSMKKKRLQPTMITYSACMKACEKAGKWDVALTLLSAMKREGFRPNVINYSTCITACQKGDQWELALQLLEKMKSEGILPNLITYSILIKFAVQKNLVNEAEKLFQAMVQANIRPDSHCYKLMIKLYTEANDRKSVSKWEQALESSLF